MKKSLFLLCLCLPCLSWANLTIDDDEKVLKVENRQKTLFIHTDYANLSTRSGKHYAVLACENVALLAEWQSLRFEKIRVLNASNNQGVEWAVSPEFCRKMIDEDWSDTELKGYLVSPYFRKF